MEATKIGKVAFFNPSKGFGFASVGEGEKNCYFSFRDKARIAIELKNRYPVVETTVYREERKYPFRAPHKGDVVYYHSTGKNKMGTYLWSWVLEEEVREIENLVCRIAEKIKNKEWGIPRFFRVPIPQQSSWTGRCGTYYPEVVGINISPLEGLIEKENFSAILLFKKGDIVVRGSSVRMAKNILEIERDYGENPHDQVIGIIPKEAEDGFWYYNGQKWQKGEVAIVHVKKEIGGGYREEVNHLGIIIDGKLLLKSGSPEIDCDFFTIYCHPPQEITSGFPIFKIEEVRRSSIGGVDRLTIDQK